MSIEFSKVSKTYQTGSVVLDETSFTINDGCFAALIGKSGQGKSTILNLISGLDRPTSGHILVNNQPITTMTDSATAKFRSTQIGFVFQFFYLQLFLTVIENVEIATYPNLKIPPKHRRIKAQQLLQSVGLAHKTNSRPSELSGGETQRVAIARALMNSPQIILADEPTGNLDSENSQLIIKLLKQIHQTTKCTVLIATHDQTITAHADTVLTINQGKITNAPR